MKMNSFLTYLVFDEDNRTKDFIKEILLKEGIMSQQIFSIILSNGILNDYLEFVITTCASTLVVQVILNCATNYWSIDSTNIGKYLLGRKIFDDQLLYQISSSTVINVEEKSEIILREYVNDKSKEPSLSSLLQSLKDNEESRQIFKKTVDKLSINQDVKEFLDKNHQFQIYRTCE